MSAPATTLLLIRHAPTPATRAFRFPLDEELDEVGRAAAASLTGAIDADRAVVSPARRCRETAAIAGFADAAVDPDLRELDFGRWAGQDPHDLWRSEPARLEAWYRDPSGDAPDGGESFAALRDRVVGALDRLTAAGGRTAVFTHGGPIKVAILHALGAPPPGMWRLEVDACSLTELRVGPGGTLALVRSNVPVGAVVA